MHNREQRVEIRLVIVLFETQCLYVYPANFAFRHALLVCYIITAIGQFDFISSPRALTPTNFNFFVITAPSCKSGYAFYKVFTDFLCRNFIKFRSIESHRFSPDLEMGKPPRRERFPDRVNNITFSSVVKRIPGNSFSTSAD
nr:hypothetical protein [Escherichia coli]